MTNTKDLAKNIMKDMSTNKKVDMFLEIREAIFADFGYGGDPTGGLRGSLGVW
jgi:hypothetical protein